MIVWGGLDDGGGMTGPEERSGGAAYNPTTRTWRKLAPPPPGVLGGPISAAVWTGEAALFWAARWPDDPSGGAYYPQSDSWRPLPRGPFRPQQGYPSVWAGSELLMIGGGNSGRLVAAALNPDTLSWRPLRGLNNLGVGGGIVWNGREAFLLGDRYPCRKVSPSCRPVFIAYNPTTDAVRRISLAKTPIPAYALWGPFASTKTGLLFRSRRNWSESFIRYRPVTRTWSQGTPPPRSCLGSPLGQHAWLGDRFVAGCGARRLQIYNPAADTWRTITPGPSPLNSRAGSAIVWTGAELIAWSGSVYKPFNPKPADGVSLRLTG